MQVLVRIVIILLVILLVWLLKRWIKRLIFIAILLCLAFFIYWLFSPSWASRLWYNVRTFPRRVTSWVSNQSFLDYDSYKLSRWLPILDEKIDDDVDNIDINDNDENISDFEPEEDISNSDEKITQENENRNESKKWEKIKKFPNIQPENFSKFLDFVDSGEDIEVSPLTWYSKTDLLKIVSNYVEEKLDENVDILVTIQYEDNEPQKIILQPQESPKNVLPSNSWLNTWNQSIEKNHATKLMDEDNESKTRILESGTSEASNTANYTKTKNSLTQKEITEAEDIFSVLF